MVGLQLTPSADGSYTGWLLMRCTVGGANSESELHLPFQKETDADREKDQSDCFFVFN